MSLLLYKFFCFFIFVIGKKNFINYKILWNVAYYIFFRYKTEIGTSISKLGTRGYQIWYNVNFFRSRRKQILVQYSSKNGTKTPKLGQQFFFRYNMLSKFGTI